MEEEEQNSLVGWELQHPGCDFAINNSIPLEFCPCSKVQCEFHCFWISLWHCPSLQSQQWGIHHLALLSMFPQLFFHHINKVGFPGVSDDSLLAMQEIQGWSLGWGRSLGEGNGYSLEYSCLENSRDRGTWQATVHGVSKSWTWLSD